MLLDVVRPKDVPRGQVPNLGEDSGSWDDPLWVPIVETVDM